MATARDLLQARLAGDREHRAGADDLDHHHDHQDRLEAFSAAKLRTDPKHALVARVRMGQILMGLAFIDNGKASWWPTPTTTTFVAPSRPSR
jgi:hypothetical protein